jgi:nucleotide-binding universal stress UspA family protein
MNISVVKNILLPTDFSREASRALSVAIELCKRHGAVLRMLHVIESPEIAASRSQDPRDSFRDIHAKGNIRAILDRLSDKITNDHRIEVHATICEGMPYEQICDNVNKAPVDLIVMGAHGAAGVKEFFIGSTAYNVIKNAGVSVLTIPADFQGDCFKNVLFTVRPVKGILEKFEKLKPLIAETDSYLHIAELCMDTVTDDKTAEYEGDIQKIIDDTMDSSITCIKEKYASNNPASTVLELSDNLAPDLIAINATLLTKQEKHYIDAYTRQVVNHARVPVLSYLHRSK